MSKKKLSKLLALYLPYVVIGLLATNLGEAWRLAAGKELGDKIVSLMDTLPAAFSNPLPSLRPFDLFIGLCCGAGMRLAVYLKGKNAKKYRHGMEYGSARWGTPKDIEPFMAPKFADNIILTKTERLMMSNRPPDPKNARNKNVLVVGGSGSGKTRFFIKPNLLQCDSKNFPVSFVVTDPKGSIGVECGEALLKHGYKLKFFNTINFSKSMRYNPMAYIHSEKDVLKLVTALMTNTKGEGQGGDPFWDKAERLLLVSLIAYLHYEAPVEEQNFATLLEMLNTMRELHCRGKTPDPEHYEVTYYADLPAMWQDVPNNEILEELFQMFNLSRPQDFEGHSLSVSDVIALKRNGKVSVHYVDSIGFKELPGFLDKKPEHSSVLQMLKEKCDAPECNPTGCRKARAEHEL